MPATRVRCFKSSTPEYHLAFQTFLDHTDQKEKALHWLEQEVQRLPDRSVMIDAGAGNGMLTQWLSKWFDSVIGIEPNLTLLEDFAATCPGSERIQSTILGADPGCRGNFILCSHVFYYIPQQEWSANIRKLMSWLAPNGVLAVAIQNPDTDCMRMVDHFIGGTFNLAELTVVTDGGAVGAFSTTLEKVEASIRTPDLQTACEIAEFVLNVLPMPNPPLWSELEHYVKHHFAREGGGFELSCHQDFLRIQRHT